ncbi:hypothetical protein NKG94_41945 [Micromonospora sp. M12]
MGDLATARGNLDAAETAYQADLHIAQQLAEADPTNAQAQRDLSISHTKMGDLATARGNLDAAEAAYQASLLIRQRLAEADPTNAQAQRVLQLFRDRIKGIKGPSSHS